MGAATQLIDDIDAFLAETELSPVTFGRYAVNDGRFITRLRDGGRCWPETEKKVRDFMSAYRLKKVRA